MSSSNDGTSGSGNPPGASTQDGAGAAPIDREEALLRQKGIGTRLKSLYADIVSEPLPDDFMALLKDMSSDEGDDKESAQ